MSSRLFELGAACMRRWVKSGFKVAISSRTAEKCDGFAKEDAAIQHKALVDA